MAYTSPSIPASGSTFANLQSNSLSGHIELQLTQYAATAAPTAAPTLGASGTGNTLPAATYYVAITETNGIGETTASPASSAQVVTAGEELTVTFPTLKSGNTARNVYVGTSNVVSSMTLAATGVTASSLNITAPLPSNSYAVSPPTVNTTGLTYVDVNGNTINVALSAIRGLKNGNFCMALANYDQLLSQFLRGKPMTFQGLMTKHRAMHTAALDLATALAEIGTLLDANAGTLGLSQDAIGLNETHRTWP